jgi:hypothetical protein
VEVEGDCVEYSFLYRLAIHCTKFWNKYSQKWNCTASFPLPHSHVSGSDLYIPTIGLIWSLYFAVLRERTLCSTAGAERRVGNCRQTEVGGSSLPSPPLLRLRREFT